MVDTIYSGVGMGEVHCLATTEARFKALTEIEKQFSILNKCSTALNFGDNFVDELGLNSCYRTQI